MNTVSTRETMNIDVSRLYRWVEPHVKNEREDDLPIFGFRVPKWVIFDGLGSWVTDMVFVDLRKPRQLPLFLVK